MGRWITVYANSDVFMVDRRPALRHSRRPARGTGPRWQRHGTRPDQPLHRAPPRRPIGPGESQRPMWKPISSGTRGDRRADRPGSRPASSASSLAHDPGADRFAADPVEGLGRDARRRGVDEGEAGVLVAAVEGQRGEGPADHVRGADAVAGVAGGGEGAAAAQGQDQRQVGRRGVDRAAPGVGDAAAPPGPGRRRAGARRSRRRPRRRARRGRPGGRPSRSARRPSRRRCGRRGWCGSSRAGRGCR